MKRFGIILLIIGLLSLLGMVFVFAQESSKGTVIVKESEKEADDDDAAVLASAKISQADALTTATKQLSGTVVKSELENEDGKPVYSFEIQSSADSKITKEVKVDAITGAFLRIENDDNEEGAKLSDSKEKDNDDNEQEGEHED